MQKSSYNTLLNQPPDNLTFQAICAVLDWLRREQSPEYERAVASANAFVLQMPAAKCRLSHWPADLAGQIVALNSGFWPVVRSLGFEGSDMFDWFPFVLASAIPDRLPPLLRELAIVLDDFYYAHELLPRSQIESLLVLHLDLARYKLLDLIPRTVRQLKWHGRPKANDISAIFQETDISLQAFDAWITDFSVFRGCLENMPTTLTQFGPNAFVGDGDRVAALCKADRFAAQVERLAMYVPGITDLHAANLGQAHFPLLVAFDCWLSQPWNGHPGLFTSAGAESLARSAWWSQLQELKVQAVYADSVLAPCWPDFLLNFASFT